KNYHGCGYGVGSGSAGSVVANRLSSNSNYSVLLLEDGGSPNPVQSVPFFYYGLVHVPQIGFQFYTVPQTNACLAMNNQKSFWPRGRGLGGSSNLNSMLFQRGNPNDYDRWAELSGNDEWKFDSVLRNFKNIEDYHGQFYNGSEKWHKQSGSGVYVSTIPDKFLLEEFFRAGEEMGYQREDVNGFQVPSFSTLDVSVKDGRRFGAYQAFLEPVLSRKNLQVYRYARVTKVHLKGPTNTAYGVTYKRHGVERFVRSKREIIISAGAIDTPKLLMISGIGPKKHLESLGIKCLIDLPVGLNLQDHILVPFGPFTLETPQNTMMLGRDFAMKTVTDYFLSSEQKRVLGNPLGANAIAYIHSSVSKQRRNVTQNAPDIQLVLVPTVPNIPDIFEKFASIKSGLFANYVGGFENKDGFMVNVMLGKPNSRGEVRLASSDPFDKPVLDPKYFTHSEDVKILVDGINFTVSMIENSKEFQKLGARLLNRHLPGCEQFKLRSQEYYECYARHMTFTVYHQCGTCAMGKGVHDPKAVVDSKLRVLHTKGLRIVDASIFPEIPNGNINAAVYMLADKASEFIFDT
ncbi:Glucose dehydrogenase [FAD, quinone], partial [Orchesella cincta]